MHTSMPAEITASRRGMNFGYARSMMDNVPMSKDSLTGVEDPRSGRHEILFSMFATFHSQILGVGLRAERLALRGRNPELVPLCLAPPDRT